MNENLMYEVAVEVAGKVIVADGFASFRDAQVWANEASKTVKIKQFAPYKETVL